MKKVLIAVFSSALIVSQLQAQEQRKFERYEFFHERNVSKTYPASGNALSIENSFGSVKFHSWDKAEVKVDVHIEATSSNKEFAQQIFDGISVADKKDGNEISFKTKHADNNSASCSNCKNNMRVNYEVYLPANMPLDVNNTFGNIEIPDYTGAVKITSKFGNLNTGALANTKKINVEFGIASIKQTANIDAVFKFTKVDIGTLSGRNKIEFEFCEEVRINLSNNLSALDIKESNTTLNLKPARDLSANYRIKSSFSSFVDRTSIGVVRTDAGDRYGADFEKTFEGKSGDGTAQVNVRSSFGRIILGEATTQDMQKRKAKTKYRNEGKVI